MVICMRGRGIKTVSGLAWNFAFGRRSQALYEPRTKRQANCVGSFVALDSDEDVRSSRTAMPTLS
jgi:hypothetical protein